MTLVLVTGGAGFIGSHTVDLLLSSGYEVRVLDLLQERVHPTGVPDYLPCAVDFVRGDVTNREVMRSALDGVSRVVHLAAYQDYMPDFSTFIHTNAESLALMLELVVADKLAVEKIVFASSQSVAGEGLFACTEHGNVQPNQRSLERLADGQWEQVCPVCAEEVAPVVFDESVSSPHTAYGISKYASELLGLRLGRRYDIATVGMRYTYVQGTRNSFYNAYSGILRRFALQLMGGTGLSIYEDGGQLRDYVNVLDVARANVIALENTDADYQVLNVGGGEGITVNEFAEIACRVFGADTTPEITGEFRLGDTRHTVSDIGKMRSLGWEPKNSIETSVRQYRDWIGTQDFDTSEVGRADSAMKDASVVRGSNG
jgi:dTDP-L-rhamnose 4-epimerase